jgi:hypothetical protein
MVEQANSWNTKLLKKGVIKWPKSLLWLASNGLQLRAGGKEANFLR